MKKLLALTILLTLGMGQYAWAWKCPQAQDASTIYRCTMTVFNDTGSAVTSGSVMAWDDDDTDFSVSLFPYAITTTTVDDPYTAGVMLTGSCPDQALCEIVVYGPIETRIADSTDDATVDTLVGTSSVAGQAGDYGTAANACALGTLITHPTGVTRDNGLGIVFVDVDCD